MPRGVKIVCTIGPATEPPDTLRRLIEAGMDVARLNFSHGIPQEHAARLSAVREAAAAVGKSVAVLQDLQGPKIRTGPLRGGSAVLEDGSSLVITTDTVPGDASEVSTTYRHLPADVRAGDIVRLSDGALEVRVEAVEGDRIRTQIVHGGLLKPHQGINLPGTRVSAPAVTAKDRTDLRWGIEHGVDYVALSFVRRPGDVRLLKRLLADRDAATPVIAKLEKPEAMDYLDEILALVDGVMVARGDLAVESSPQAVPILQKEIIREANRRGKLVITATQMMESMVEHQMPTRAEASDVANAVLDGTDAVMLSGETAIGRFPVECVRIMDHIICSAEARYADFGTPSHPDYQPGMRSAISRAVRGLDSEPREIAAVAVHTTSGATALRVSKERCGIPVYGFASDPQALARMALFRDVTPLAIEPLATTDELIARMEVEMLGAGIVQPGETIAVVIGSRPGSISNLLHLHRIGDER